MKLRIVFLCDEYPPFRNGGIGTYTKEVSERLVQRGHEVTIIGTYRDTMNDAESVENGVRLIRLAPSRLGMLGSRLRIYRKVKDHAAEHGLDVLESQEYAGFLAGWPKTNFKIIVRLHGSVFYFNHEFDDNSWKNIPWRVVERMTLKRADQIVSVSQYTAKRTKELFNISKPIQVIHNGVALPPQLRSNTESQDPLRVVFAGSMQAKKGFLQLLRAWKTVLAKLPGAELHLAGKDNSRQLIKLEEILGDSGSVKYHGVLSKPALEDLYRKMDLAVFPSFVEAFSLAPMEAMAVGLPVVYTELCSGHELIKDGETGLLVDPNNEEEIADVILSFASMTTAQRNELGKRGQQHIRSNFSIDRLVQDNEALMLDLVLGAETSRRN